MERLPYDDEGRRRAIGSWLLARQSCRPTNVRFCTPKVISVASSGPRTEGRPAARLRSAGAWRFGRHAHERRDRPLRQRAARVTGAWPRKRDLAQRRKVKSAHWSIPAARFSSSRRLCASFFLSRRNGVRHHCAVSPARAFYKWLAPSGKREFAPRPTQDYVGRSGIRRQGRSVSACIATQRAWARSNSRSSSVCVPRNWSMTSAAHRQ